MRVLIVAYYFPPKGGAGTQRFAKFCKYLPQSGIEPVVLTVDSDSSSEHAPHDDATLWAEVPCRVERIARPASSAIAQRVRRALRLHVDEDEWAEAALARARQLVTRESFDAVLTTLSPYASSRIGERLQREFGLPWLVDLRDPWALDAWRAFPSPLHARLDLWRMRRAITRADFVIANVPEARRAFIDNGARPERCVVIPNGFDDEDFVDAPMTAATPVQPFRLVHVGTFHPADQAAGLTRNTAMRVRNRQIEPLARSGYYLLHAVARWRDAVGPAIASDRLAVHLYGHDDPSHRRLIDQLGLGKLVTVHGYVAHRDAVAALSSAHGVFVPLHGTAPGERALVVPGKLYEAMASERPVLAAMPPGDGADLIRNLAAGTVVSPTDIAMLQRALADLVEARDSGSPQPGCVRQRLAAFARCNLTRRLAAVFEAAVARRGRLDMPDLWAIAESA